MVGTIACLVGLTIKSIYKLFSLCSDLVFVILFPQLVGAVYFPFVNTYGSLCAFVLGLFFRIASGEPFIGLPALIKYPMYDYINDQQKFPFRILCMLISAVTLLVVSALTNWLFTSGCLSRDCDIFRVMERQEKSVNEASGGNEVPMQETVGEKYKPKEEFNNMVLQNHGIAEGSNSPVA